MSKYVSYSPGQGWLLPPRVEDELGEDHLALFVHQLVERLDLSDFEATYSYKGRGAYPPQMLLKLWLYAYAVGLTSSRRLEVRVREDLGFRFLADNLKPDFWTLNAFRRRHRRRLNDVFTQVLEAAREMGMGRLGRVAIDSTALAASASADRRDTAEGLRKERARLRQRIRRWQQRCDAEDVEQTPAKAAAVRDWRRRLDEIPAQLKQLRKIRRDRSPNTRRKKPDHVSRTDPEARSMRKRGGFCLGYTCEVAVSDDHLIVAQRVHQRGSDKASLATMTKLVESECGRRPSLVVADAGYHELGQVLSVERTGVTAIVPDQVLTGELKGGEKVEMNDRQKRRNPGLFERRKQMRKKESRRHMRRRKAIVELVFGVLKQQRGMRQFRCRGEAAAGAEWTLATTAFNLTRMWKTQLSGAT